jgi:hypothetical protein
MLFFTPQFNPTYAFKFANPIYNHWFKDYQSTAQVRYWSIIFNQLFANFLWFGTLYVDIGGFKHLEHFVAKNETFFAHL